jgi:hypothetical protein
MTQISGHIPKSTFGSLQGLYNLIADHKVDTVLLFSDTFNIPTSDIRVTLRRTDISAQVMVDRGDIKRKCGTKIVFIVNRLDEYETFDTLETILPLLTKMIKVKERNKKLSKITTIMR